jgi:succinate-semialdehyde dehydrogenase/glutarate-semialdehyde dehydrogenase
MPTLTATAQLESFNPATGELVGAVPVTAPEDVQAVVDGVAAVQPAWARLTLQERGAVLQRVARAVLDESDDIRDLIVREQGKPRNEAFSMEILPTVDALGWIAQAGPEILAD